MSERKGMGGHHSADAATTTWLTPPHIIEALGGPDSFDLDPCAFPGWATARAGYVLGDPPPPRRPCEDHGAEDCAICSWSGRGRPEREVWRPQLRSADGLAAPWFGRVWLNAPYGAEVWRWLARLGDHGHGSALIFARTETEAFHRQVWERATGLLFLEGRLFFHHADGRKAAANAGAPSVLCAYGADDLERMAFSGLRGALVPLRFARSVLVEAVSGTWREVVMDFMRGRHGPVTVAELYRAFARHPKAKACPSWRAKLRQTLQRGPFRPLGAGAWEVAHG